MKPSIAMNIFMISSTCYISAATESAFMALSWLFVIAVLTSVTTEIQDDRRSKDGLS